MPVLEIKKFNDPILRTKCQEVREIDEEIGRIVENMKETLKEKPEGIGLSAPQVGIDKRIIILKLDLERPSFFALINPQIKKKSKKKEREEEGCLSFPGIFLKIKRAKEAEIEGLNEKGEKITIKAEGILARVFQHEIDHLEGILFFDRLPFFPRLRFYLKYGSY